MKNQNLVSKLSRIEKEVRDLKTSSTYRTTRSVSYLGSIDVYTGIYKITYDTNDQPIISQMFLDLSQVEEELWDYIVVKPRTRIGNTQIVEVGTNTVFDGGDIHTSMRILSNYPVLKIERIE